MNKFVIINCLLLAVGCAGLQQELANAQYNRRLTSTYSDRVRAEQFCEKDLRQKLLAKGADLDLIMSNAETRHMYIGLKLDCLQGLGWI